MMNEFDEILAYLDYIRSQSRLVSVVNTFMGVSYSLNVNILQVSSEDGSLTISTQHRQKLSLLPNIWVSIHSDLFPFPVKAKVASVDSQHNTAVLYQFEYRRSTDENRSQPRYLTRFEHPIQINVDEKDLNTGLINDISTNGISVILKKPTGDMEKSLDNGVNCHLSFSLQVDMAASPHPFTTSAEIVYVLPIEGGYFRLGMKMYPTVNDQSLIRRYIFDRHTEFFQEIGPSHIVN